MIVCAKSASLRICNCWQNYNIISHVDNCNLVTLTSKFIETRCVRCLFYIIMHTLGTNTLTYNAISPGLPSLPPVPASRPCLHRSLATAKTHAKSNILALRMCVVILASNACDKHHLCQLIYILSGNNLYAIRFSDIAIFVES